MYVTFQLSLSHLVCAGARMELEVQPWAQATLPAVCLSLALSHPVTAAADVSCALYMLVCFECMHAARSLQRHHQMSKPTLLPYTP